VIATKFGAGMFPGDPNGGGAGRKAIMQQVDFPADLLQNIARSYQQAGATINGVESTEFRR
jgi:hypothetical protein